MRKVEMVNRMIILGCISESDRDLFMSMTIEVVTKIYIKVIPLKLEFLKKKLKKVLTKRPEDAIL